MVYIISKKLIFPLPIFLNAVELAAVKGESLIIDLPLQITLLKHI